jgi:hypothetical protein
MLSPIETLGKMTPRDFADVVGRSTKEAHPAPVGKAGASSTKVWVNTRSGVYHCPASECYGRTKEGEYMTQAEAQKNGYRPVGGRSCR